jgi:hypothetical protein
VVFAWGEWTCGVAAAVWCSFCCVRVWITDVRTRRWREANSVGRVPTLARTRRRRMGLRLKLTRCSWTGGFARWRRFKALACLRRDSVRAVHEWRLTARPLRGQCMRHCGVVQCGWGNCLLVSLAADAVEDELSKEAACGQLVDGTTVCSRTAGHVRRHLPMPPRPPARL